MRMMLKKFDDELRDSKVEEQYATRMNEGDVNYFTRITIPSFISKHNIYALILNC